MIILTYLSGITCLPLSEQACIQLVTGPLHCRNCGKAFSSPKCELSFRLVPLTKVSIKVTIDNFFLVTKHSDAGKMHFKTSDSTGLSRSLWDDSLCSSRLKSQAVYSYKSWQGGYCAWRCMEPHDPYVRKADWAEQGLWSKLTKF